MLYIGYFTFDFDMPKLGKQDAEFTYIVEADSIDAACQTMAEQILEKHRDLLRETEQLMMDDCIEIKEVPAGGVLLKISHAKSAEWPVMRTILPNYDGHECGNYRQGPDPEDDLEAANAYDQEPFLVLNEDAETD